METEEKANYEDDGNINIYDDLEEYDLGEEVEKLKTENKKLEAIICSLKEEIEKLNSTIMELKETQSKLTNNISTLFITAKAEIERKDRMIEELRTEIDNRRLKKFNPEYNKRKEREKSPSEINNQVKKIRLDDNTLKDDTSDCEKQQIKCDDTRQESRSIQSNERHRCSEDDTRRRSSSRHSRERLRHSQERYKDRQESRSIQSNERDRCSEDDTRRRSSSRHSRERSRHSQERYKDRQESRSIQSNERHRCSEDDTRLPSSSRHSRERSRHSQERYKDRYDRVKHDSRPRHSNDTFNEYDRYDSRSRYYKDTRGNNYEDDGRYSGSEYPYDNFSYSQSRYNSDNRYSDRMQQHMSMERDVICDNRGEDRYVDWNGRNNFEDRIIENWEEYRDELDRVNRYEERSDDHHSSTYCRNEEWFSQR